MSKQSKRIKAVIAGTLAVIFASSVFSGTRAMAEVPVAEVDLDLPRQVRMVDAASVISVKGAAEALEEKPDAVCIPELYSVGAAKALLTDDTGAKEAAKTAVGAIIEAEIAVEDVREAQIVSENEAEARDPEHSHAAELPQSQEDRRHRRKNRICGRHEHQQSLFLPVAGYASADRRECRRIPPDLFPGFLDDFRRIAQASASRILSCIREPDGGRLQGQGDADRSRCFGRPLAHLENGL